MNATSAVEALLAEQDLVASRRQLRELGVSPEAVRWNAGRNWRVLLPSVYQLSRDSTTHRQRLRAALLWAGDGSVLSGTTAARLHGLRSVDPGERVHLLVPHPKRSRSAAYATARRTMLLESPTTRWGFSVSTPARAVVDSASMLRTAEGRESLLIEAVQRKVTTVDELAEWALRLRPREGSVVLVALRAAASGAWSIPEHRLLELVSTSRILPQPMPNPELRAAGGQRLITPDAWFDDVAMAVMVHSHRHHSQGPQWDATVAADADLVAAGIVVVGVTPRQIQQAPKNVLDRIERTHEMARARSRPEVFARAQHPLTS